MITELLEYFFENNNTVTVMLYENSMHNTCVIIIRWRIGDNKHKPACWGGKEY